MASPGLHKLLPDVAPNYEGAPRGKEPQVAMKRFTIDVSVELHTRIKVACAGRGQKMANMLRELLEREFAKS
jgi:hypothetical protein